MNDDRYVELPPCPVCGNDFIEIFGSGKSWWVGCKPCSKRDGGPEHFHVKSRAEGVERWNTYVTDSKRDHDRP